MNRLSPAQNLARPARAPQCALWRRENSRIPAELGRGRSSHVHLPDAKASRSAKEQTEPTEQIEERQREMDTRQQDVSNPLSFRVSRGQGASFVVTEAHGRIGGVFGDLSSAMRFARLEAMNRGRPLDLRFDESLAFIRAAG